MSDSNVYTTDSGGQLENTETWEWKQEQRLKWNNFLIGLLTHNVIVLLSSQPPWESGYTRLNHSSYPSRTE